MIALIIQPMFAAAGYSLLYRRDFQRLATRSQAHVPSGNGHWLKETALAPGTYEYCLVVDGQWMPDPLAKDYVSNPFGGRNSILEVARSPEAAHLADAENLPFKNANKQKTQKIWTHKHKQFKRKA